MLRNGLILSKQISIILIFLDVFIDCKQNCWTSFDAKEHFEIMDTIDDRYAKVRKDFQLDIGGANFDKDMLFAMLKARGVAERALHEAQGDQSMIPAGINLGGYCMMKMPKSMLFFHRMKLRNNTIFRVTDLENDFENLLLHARILLNDLHLFGSYDYTTIIKSGYLAYEPSFGQVELLLKNVVYKMEGRYRLLKNRLNIELVISELEIDDILMMYKNKNSSLSVQLQRKNIDLFIQRLQADLDKWLKDYFNDYLMYFVVAENNKIQKYNREKTVALNLFTDKAIDTIIDRIRGIQANAVKIPSFTIYITNDKEIRLKDGVLRGLDSIYRRATVTGTKEANGIRKVDTVVGFSSLKLIYRYDAILKSGLPPVTGVLILTADELTAHMGLSLMKDIETTDLRFKFIEQAKPESLTIEGPANRMISNFKFLLERHIIAIMSNTLMHNIKMLGTLVRCVPLFPAHKGVGQYTAADNYVNDDMLVNYTISKENTDIEKSQNETAPSNFKYYHRRIPLRVTESVKKAKKF